MSKFFHKFTKDKRIITLLTVWFLIFLGVSLRAYKADVYPVDNNDDGLFYAWAGISFWENPLKPITHTIFDNNNPALTWRSQFMDFIPIERFGIKLARPWLDHPPLGAAIIGLPAKLLGYHGFELIPQLIVRFPALLASIITMLLTYLLAGKLMGKKTAIWALVFLATVPYYVTAHRQSFLENIFIPMFLGALYYLLKNKLVGTAILASLCGWIKLPGFSVPIMIALWLWRRRQIKSSLIMLGAGAVSVISYLSYGLLVDKEAFLFILQNQGNRGAFVSSFFNQITQPRFYGLFSDGWMIFGLIASLWLLVKSKPLKLTFYKWFLSMWLLVIFLTAGRNNNSPWYYYPLIPFGAMAIGYYVRKVLKHNQLWLILPLWLLGLTGLDLIKFELNPTVLRLATLIFFTPFVLRQKKISYCLTRILIVGLVILNIYVTLRFPTVHCQEERCLAPTKIILKL